MKILAVVPACEGSASLPNKNIRMINGKPMIYYSINNARKSEYISDILVTTNSEDILAIARQMGTMVRQRDSSLCSPSVSLDKVVYDAGESVDYSEYDYVVTMQSISPTLKHTTLDNAIRKTIECGCDTMISVVNRSNFYWSVENGRAVPYQKERMNKHQLTPYYMETGAFLITRPKFITESSRIGDKVELYELCPDEAVDVFTFGDLKQAENIISRKSVAFFANGNNQIGLGHIYRVLQLADEFFTKPDIYFDSNITKREFFGQTKHNLISVDGKEGLYAALKETRYDVFINDILSTSAEYMSKLKQAMPDARIVNFEDEGDGAPMADMVFNALYEESVSPNVRFGSEYFIAPKLFLLYEPVEIREKVRDVLITFGGADPCNYTDTMLDIIKDVRYDDIRFHVVIGRAKANFSELMECRKSNIEMLYDISNMPEVMSQCDIAFTSRGRTGFELALLGIPSVSIAQNEREELHNFMSAQNGFDYLGRNPSADAMKAALDRLLLMNSEQRGRIQKKMLAKNLRYGRKHILNLIDNM